MKRYCSVALVLLLVVFFSSKCCVGGRPLLPRTHSGEAVRDLQINKELKKESSIGEKDSFRKIPWSGASPIQNKCNPPIDVEGSRKQQITASRKP